MFVIYHKETTIRLDRLVKNLKTECFATVAAGKSALTRACKKDTTLIKESFGIVEYLDFYSNIEKKEMKISLMSGKPFVQGVNTPAYLDPSREQYWSA